MDHDHRMTGKEISDEALAMLLNLPEPMRAGDEFRARLLAQFDDRRRQKSRSGPIAIADAIGWRQLGRPWAPAGLGAMLVALGFFSGVATASAGPSDDDAFATFAAAYNQTLAVAPETPSWVEE